MLTRAKKIAFVLLVPLVLLSVPLVSDASLGSARSGLQRAGSAAYGGGAEAGGAAEVPVIIGSIINAALGLIGVILVVLMIYGGFLWMTAGGNSEQVDKAKKIMTNGIIGIIIVMAAYSISYFVLQQILAATGTGVDSMPALE